MSTSLPFRQIHLDFHTGPAIPKVGQCFDLDEFGRTMQDAHVNGVNLFAKCHHGHLYYKTSRAERHPGLSRGIGLLEDQIEALHRYGIKTPIYISVQCDEYAAHTHPEWVARQLDGKPVGPGPFKPGWTILDMSTGYQDYLADQLAEILEKFHPVDGIWFDMCWDQTSSSESAISAMLEQDLNPEDENDRQTFARSVSQQYMRRYYKMVKDSSPDASVYFNCRPAAEMRHEIDCFEQLEIEALPTGGWSYLHFPTIVRYLRTLDKPTLGMTARFHKSWADFGGLKPDAALIYETAQMVANGAACCIGDQLHPRGTLDPAAYALIGRVYKRIEEREPWLEGAVPVTQIGLFAAENHARPAFSTTTEGAVRMLTQLRHQFDIIDWESDWDRYDLLVLQDYVRVDAAFADRLNAYISKGGKVLATGNSGLTEDASGLTWDALGVTAHGVSPYTTTYLRFSDEIAPGQPPTDHVMYEQGARVKAAGGQVLARVVEPYFERDYKHFSSHFQTPSDALTDWAAAVQNGSVGYIPAPIFTAFAKHGNTQYRSLVKSVLDRLVKPILRCDGPSGLEATILKQVERTIVHLLYFSAERRAVNIDLIEDIVPLHNIHLSVKLVRRPQTVYLAPEQKSLDFKWEDGNVEITVPTVNGHAMIVLE